MALTKLSRQISEARSATIQSPEPTTIGANGRRGWVPGVPIGGSTETNPGGSTVAGSLTRASWMNQLFQAYLACTYVSDCIDVIARTITAGGVQAVPNTLSLEGAELPKAPPPVQAVQQLLEYINDQEDTRQLMRSVVTDLLVFGDSFTEVVYLNKKPIALYQLDPRTMDILNDEHGDVLGYFQQMDTGRTALFYPHQVIHVKMDAPGAGMYGVSPIQKNYVPITNYLFTAGLIQETMKRGDPSRLHVDWPIALPISVQQRLQQQYQFTNLGAKNIGNLFETKGQTGVQELGVNKLSDWNMIEKACRDEIISGFGVPPSKVGVIESANIGGGQGTSQDRSFRVNTCGPISELVLEKFSFRLLYQCYGVSDWHLKFGEVDWRDDMTIEQIRDMRVRNGSWCVDEETEIRCEDGWKRYDQVIPGERVLTLNHNSGMSEWQPVEKIAVFPAESRPMARMHSRTHSSLSTVNHRWPVLRVNGNDSRARDAAWTTSEKMHVMDRVITSAQSADRPIYAKHDDSLVELVAWFWTEGHSPVGSDFAIITQKKQNGIDRIRLALEKQFGPQYAKTHYRPKNGTAGAWIERKYDEDRATTFRIASEYGRTILDHVEDHAVKSEFLLDLTQEQLELFIEISLMADGINSKFTSEDGCRVLTQKRQRAAEQFHFACILAGLPAHMYIRVRNDVDGRPEPHGLMYCVTLCKTGTVQAKRYHYEEIIYDGVVWCPVTANQTWLARRDNKVYFTGNTIDRYRSDIGEPPTPGGDIAVLVDRQNLVAWRDMSDLSAANLAAIVTASTQSSEKGVGAGPAAPGAKPSTPGPPKPNEGYSYEPFDHLAYRDDWEAYRAARAEMIAEELERVTLD